MRTVHAVYTEGVFRPIEGVELPEDCEVEFEPRVVKTDRRQPSLDNVYALLSKRFNSGQHDVAERHNEHQP